MIGRSGSSAASRRWASQSGRTVGCELMALEGTVELIVLPFRTVDLRVRPLKRADFEVRSLQETLATGRGQSSVTACPLSQVLENPLRGFEVCRVVTFRELVEHRLKQGARLLRSPLSAQ